MKHFARTLIHRWGRWERDTPCYSFIFTFFSLFGFGPNYCSCLNIYQSTCIFLILAVCADPVQDRTSPRQSRPINNSTGWCYTMLRPVRSLPVSSDPAGYARTKERDRKREKEKGVREKRIKWKLRELMWSIVCLDKVSLLINVILVILGGAADQTHLCKYSRGVRKENKRAFKESWEWAWQRSMLSERGHKRSLSEGPAVVFQCQIVPRACCHSTPFICIWGTPAIPLQIKGLQSI